MSGPPDHLPPAPPSGALELARLLSFATRIEPELLRAVRLRFLPRLDAGAEADLWFSEWVGARTPEAIALLPQCLPHLRAGLAERLRADPGLAGVLDLVTAYHHGLSPALLLEEQVTWHALTGDLDAAGRQLDRVLHALVREERSGLAGWFAEAWHRLPAEARSTPTAWGLAHASRSHVPAFDAGQPPDLALADVAALGDALGEVRLGVLREGDTLVLGRVRGRNAAAVSVPDTHPRLVEIVSATGTRSVRVAEDAVAVRVEVGHGPVHLRTGTGRVYRIDPAPERTAPDFDAPLMDDLVRRLGEEDAGRAAARLADALTEMLARSRGEDDHGSLLRAVRLSDRVSEAGHPAGAFPRLGTVMAEAYLAYGILQEDRGSLERALHVSGLVLDSPGFATDLTAHAVRGGALRGLFAYTGDTAQLRRSLEAAVLVADRPGATDPGHRRLVAELLSASLALHEADPRDAVLREALDLADRAPVTAEDADGALLTLPLAGLLLARHGTTGDPAALERVERLALDSWAPDEPRDTQTERQLLLARLRLARFRESGSREAFEQALKHARWAVSLVPARSRLRGVRPGLLLADVLRLRFALTGERAALDEAVALLRGLTADMPASSPWYGNAHHDLARCLVDGHLRSGEPAELREARAACAAVLAGDGGRGPATALRRAAQVLDGECLLLDHVASGDPDVLQEAVLTLMTSWEAPRGTAPTRSPWCPAPGIVSALLRVPARGPEGEMLAELLDAWEAAVRSAEPDPASRRASLSSLSLVRADLLSRRPEPSPVRLLQADEEVQRAVSSAVHPLLELRARLCRTELALLLGDVEEASRALEHATGDLTPLLVLPPAPAHHDVLAVWERLSREVAAHSIAAREQGRALAVLERCGIVMTRYGAGAPDASPSPAVAELRWLWAYLHLGLDDMSRSRLRRREIQWQMATSARAAPGASELAGSPAPDVLHPASVAAEGPVVVLNAAAHRCDALLVTRQGVSALRLDVRLEELRERARRFRSARPRDASDVRASLAWLAESTVWPVLQALGFMPQRSDRRSLGPLEHMARTGDETLPRLWWCPTGPFGGLPLHAASGSGRMALDHAVHSYVPSLHALASARYRERRADDDAEQRMLVVLAREEPRWAREEVEQIRNLVPHTRILGGADLTVEEIVSHLPGHAYFHYSGSAGRHGGRTLLRVAEGLGGQHPPGALVPHGALAYLSACDTTGDLSPGTDGGWTVAASLQSAGFRHVIGALGRVEDRAAMLIATAFYRRLRTSSRRLSPERAARALHGALQEARGDGFLLDALAMVHMGP
ncbi:CHAT domain-containing protein [Streptomyces griseus]|uniref:CHAT domain-containing protein n=1 Tax=Streptomyces griseus TaxID=1911 RepID=UPI0004C74002|nr:CHAT domain-containing protein [Streptomyces griseus]